MRNYSKRLGAFRGRTDVYQVIYVGNRDDSVAGLPGGCRLPNQIDDSGLVFVKADYFNLDPAVHVAPELDACFCLIGIILSTDSQNVAQRHETLCSDRFRKSACFEVVPIGVTSVLIGVIQALFLIRPNKFVIPASTVQQVGDTLTVDTNALQQLLLVKPNSLEVIQGAWITFTDFLAPSVWFIFGSIIFGLTFSQTGLAKRMAYKMLSVVGEKTSMPWAAASSATALVVRSLRPPG